MKANKKNRSINFKINQIIKVNPKNNKIVTINQIKLKNKEQNQLKTQKPQNLLQKIKTKVQQKNSKISN